MEMHKIIEKLRDIGIEPYIGGKPFSHYTDKENLIKIIKKDTVLESEKDILHVLELGLQKNLLSAACFHAFFGNTQTQEGTRYSVGLFCGGRGGKRLIEAPQEKGDEVHVIVNPYDDGLSTGRLRKYFNMVGPSDIRKNHINLLSADNEEHQILKEILSYRVESYEQYEEIVKLLESEETSQLEEPGGHSIIAALSKLREEKRKMISKYLCSFGKALKKKLQKVSPLEFFDMSLGNCIYVGAYFYHGLDMMLAIRSIEKFLLELSDRVYITSEQNLWLVAVTNHQKLICSEAELVNNLWLSGIREIFLLPEPINSADEFYSRYKIDNYKTLMKTLESIAVRPIIYSEVFVVINKVDILVYSPGTLYSSQLPTYLSIGVPEIIRQSKAVKVLVTNLCTDNETFEFRASDFIYETFRILASQDSKHAHPGDYLDYILLNNPGRDIKGSKANKTFVENDIERARSLGVECIVRELDSHGTEEGYHDGKKVSAYIRQLKALSDIGLRIRDGQLETYYNHLNSVKLS